MLALYRPREQRKTITLLTILGLTSWTAIAYALHRFVLYGLHRLSAGMRCTIPDRRH